MNLPETVISREISRCVNIGSLVLFCENFKAVGLRSFAEKTTVSGETFFSDTSPRALRVTFSGRIYNTDVPLNFLLCGSSMVNDGEKYDVVYRGMKFTGCMIQSFNVEDRGEGYIQASITLITSDDVCQESDEN
jgi:hypothetical protein